VELVIKKDLCGIPLESSLSAHIVLFDFSSPACTFNLKKPKLEVRQPRLLISCDSLHRQVHLNIHVKQALEPKVWTESVYVAAYRRPCIKGNWCIRRSASALYIQQVVTASQKASNRNKQSPAVQKYLPLDMNEMICWKKLFLLSIWAFQSIST
jgi:hypothetical protein